MDTIHCNFNDVKMIAHRGLSGIETENTMPAFVAAANRSYYGIETDVHVTRDGRFILHHDDSATRLADSDLILEETDYDTLRALPLKWQGEYTTRPDLRMPSLSEYITVCKTYGKKAVLELKNRIQPDKIREITEIIRDLGHLEDTIFISFYMENLIDLRGIAPDAVAQFLTSNPITDEMLGTMKTYRLDMDAKYTLLTRELVDKMHGLGMTVNCWTCDGKENAEALRAMGVDQITSNILE